MGTFIIIKECWVQIIASTVASLTAMSNGMAYGWSAPMIPYLMGNTTHIHITQNQGVLLETLTLYGNIVTLPISVFIIRKYGRHKTLIASSLLSCVHWIMILFTSNLYVLYVARFLVGTAMSLVMASPIYIGEIAEPRIRGCLTTTIHFAAMTGIIIVYSAGVFLPFYAVPIIGILVCTMKVAIFPFMPRSPYFLLYINENEKARKALSRLRSNRTSVDKEFQEIATAVERQKDEKGRIKDMFLIPNNRYALLIMILLSATQQFSGLSVIKMNAHLILKEADSIYVRPSIAAILFSIFIVATVVVASSMVDKIGRRIMLLVSSILTGVTHLIITIYFHLKNSGYHVKSFSWLPATCIVMFAVTFHLGLGIVPMVLVSEIYSAKIKALGVIIFDFCYMVFALLSIKIYMALVENVGIHAAFYLFTFTSFVAAIVSYFVVPETKGKTLEEIQLMLKGHEKVDADGDKRARDGLME